MSYRTVGSAISIALLAFLELLPGTTYASYTDFEETGKGVAIGSCIRRKNQADLPSFPHGTD